MPKALAECFPMAKVASIATRGWTGKLKAKKRGNKVAMIVKPRKCLLPKMSKKRQSTDKIEGETRRSKSSVDFDDVAKVESTKGDQDKATTEQANATAWTVHRAIHLCPPFFVLTL